MNNGYIFFYHRNPGQGDINEIKILTMENLRQIEKINSKVLSVIKESTIINKTLYEIEEIVKPTLYFIFFPLSLIVAFLLAANKMLSGTMLITLLLLSNLIFAMFCFWRSCKLP